MKKYNVGFFGGKFLPLHKGHELCVKTMVEECEIPFVLMFIGGKQELEYFAKHDKQEWLSLEKRQEALERLKLKYPSITTRIIDVTNLRLPNGEEDWEAETPLVRSIVGNKINAVYGSELSYVDYFNRAYPEATIRIVNSSRNMVRISATEIRAMEEEARKEWMI